MFQWCNALFISISELNMLVKIGVILMPFSNPTCHFRATADFTVCTVCTWCKVSCSSEMAHMIWKWHENDSYFHQHIQFKNANKKCITSLEHTFLDDGLNLLLVIYYGYEPKLWGRLVNLKWMKCFNFFAFL